MSINSSYLYCISTHSVLWCLSNGSVILWYSEFFLTGSDRQDAIVGVLYVKSSW